MIKVFNIFKKNVSSIHHAAFWLGFFAIISGFLGLFRDRLLAGEFGASRILDIYYSAFRVPDFLYTLMLFMTSATAIIPLFVERWETGKEKAADFFGSLMLFFSFTVFIFSAVFFLFMPQIIEFLFPGFSINDKQTVVFLSRIMLFSPIFLGFSNLISGVTQTFKRFFAFALSPVFYNLGIIIGFFIFVPIFGVNGLVFGVILGAFLHMGIQIPSLIGIELNFGFKKFNFSDIKKVVLISVPRTVGLAVNQISIMVFTVVASTLSSGSIAVFNLAQNLGYIPVTVIGLSYSVAAFPALSSFSLRKEKNEFLEHFSSAFRHIVFWTLPFSALVLILRAQIVRVILGSGAFSWQDTRLTAASLFLLSLSVVFQSLFLLLVRSFYAEGETKKTLVVNIVSMATSIGIMFYFLKLLEPLSPFANTLSALLDISDIVDIRVLALSIGILIGSALNFVLLLFVFKMTFGWFPIGKTQKSLFQIFLGSLVGALMAYFGLNIFSSVFNLHTFSGIFLQGFFSGILGILAICAVLYFTKNKEFFEVLESFKTTIWRDRIPAPEPEKLP
ncbi:MAG TPA: lipid II flippase MurJ [Candidatus Paceibacterota bacterium]